MTPKSSFPAGLFFPTFVQAGQDPLLPVRARSRRCARARALCSATRARERVSLVFPSLPLAPAAMLSSQLNRLVSLSFASAAQANQRTRHATRSPSPLVLPGQAPIGDPAANCSTYPSCQPPSADRSDRVTKYSSVLRGRSAKRDQVRVVGSVQVTPTRSHTHTHSREHRDGGLIFHLPHAVRVSPIASAYSPEYSLKERNR